MIKTPRSPRESPRGGSGNTPFPLGDYWKQKTTLGEHDNPFKHCERVRGEILTAMQARQASVTAFTLHVCSEELTGVSKERARIVSETAGTLWFPEDKWIHTQGSGVDSLIPLAGYTLNERFRGILQWFTQNGLEYALTTQLTLVVYWHPETGGEDNHNQLYKYVLGLWIAVPEEDIFKRHRDGIRRAMAAGQTKAVICYLFETHGYHRAEREWGTRVCKETRELFTDQIIGIQQWCVDDKYTPLLKWITERERLQWSLRFMFKHKDSAELFPWALLIAHWN
jgi:hypothetical protein